MFETCLSVQLQSCLLIVNYSAVQCYRLFRHFDLSLYVSSHLIKTISNLGLTCYKDKVNSDKADNFSLRSHYSQTISVK